MNRIRSVSLTMAVAGLFAMQAAMAQQTASASVRNDRDLRAANALLAHPVTVHLIRMPLKQAINAVAASAKVLVQYRAETIEAYPGTVSLQATEMPLVVAFERILSGTNLRVVSDGPMQLAIIPVGTGGVGAKSTGVVTGTVTDAATHRPLAGARVLLDDATTGVTTGQGGTFRLPNVPAGEHTVTVRVIGQQKQRKSVIVQDGQSAVLDFVLNPSVNTLDQVVVTGTVVQTELKAVPNAITVITAKEIEQRGITKIDQLFRGDVPGVFAVNQGSSNAVDEVAMFSRGATALTYNSAGTIYIGGANITNPIKTYVDGVELADPTYLSQIDPKSIERIEILTGPQASTIYGSNAINGVMQIFTKRGTTSTPQFTLHALSGWVQNNYRAALTPQHDYSASLTGVEGRIAYTGGGSWNYMGPWTPSNQTARTGWYAGTRLELPIPAGRLTTDLTLRRALTQTVQRGDNAALAAYTETGLYRANGSIALTAPATQQLVGQTLGLTAGYAPTSWWSHELTLGQDGTDWERTFTQPGYADISDTSLSMNHETSDRRSIHYATTMRIPVTSRAQAIVTLGTDEWQTKGYGWFTYNLTQTIGSLGNTAVYRSRDHNAGTFLQTQLGVLDRLFLTYGVRRERNPGIGDKATVLPGRLGVAYTQDIGAVTAKLRGSYGRSIRPPNPTFKLGTTYAPRLGADPAVVSSIEAIWGNYYTQLPNPELVPESQHGGEGGVELYFGTRGSLVVTRYNQTVNDLIDNVPAADSVRSFMPNPLLPFFGGSYTCAEVIANFGTGYCSEDAAGYAYVPQPEYLNIGSIRNQGWELQPRLNLGPLTTTATYSWTKSRVIGITPKYRAQFPASSYPMYQKGATFQYLPEHTWALGITYTTVTTTVGLNITGVGQIRSDRNDFYFQNIYSGIRLPQNRLTVTTGGKYANINPGYPVSSLTATRRVSARLEGVLNVQNLLDRYRNDVSGQYATIGRQSSVGFRLRL